MPDSDAAKVELTPIQRRTFRLGIIAAMLWMMGWALFQWRSGSRMVGPLHIFSLMTLPVWIAPGLLRAVLGPPEVRRSGWIMVIVTAVLALGIVPVLNATGILPPIR
jgi:hypothetical protein